MPDYANPKEARVSLAALRARALAVATPEERAAIERRASVMEAIIEAWESQIRAVGAPWDALADASPGHAQPGQRSAQSRLRCRAAPTSYCRTR